MSINLQQPELFADEYQETAIKLLESVKRPGIDILSDYLINKSDFFTAPASTNSHGACEKGLIMHSLATYENLLWIIKTHPNSRIRELQAISDSLIICGLLHDFCKIKFYRRGSRNRKNDLGKWEAVEIWEIEDQIPLGHGEKSVIMLQWFIRLTMEEAYAIRWHMGGWDDAGRSYAGSLALGNAMLKHPLIVALHMADMATCYFDEK